VQFKCAGETHLQTTEALKKYRKRLKSEKAESLECSKGVNVLPMRHLRWLWWIKQDKKEQVVETTCGSHEKTSKDNLNKSGEVAR
jgi:hypothetical protein